MQDYLAFATQHLVLTAAIAAVLLALVANEIHGTITGGTPLSAPAAVRLINDQDALIVDVRPTADFKKGHMLGALNLPNDKLKDRLGELPKDKSRPLVVVCALGGTSREAALTLVGLGHAKAQALKGGINAWTAASLPLTTK